MYWCLFWPYVLPCPFIVLLFYCDCLFCASSRLVCLFIPCCVCVKLQSRLVLYATKSCPPECLVSTYYPWSMVKYMIMHYPWLAMPTNAMEYDYEYCIHPSKKSRWPPTFAWCLMCHNITHKSLDYSKSSILKSNTFYTTGMLNA